VNDKFTPLYSFETGENGQGGSLRRTAKDHSYHEGAVRGTPKTMGLGGAATQAIQYFILNRCSFSGSTLSGGFSQEASNGRFTSSIDRIAALDFADIEKSTDFLEFVESALVAERTTCVLDPPYFLEKSQSYTGTTDMHESFNHESLYGMLRTKKLGANLQQLPLSGICTETLR
jgi:DNA adenine methylase